MLKALYTSATGMKAQEIQIDNTANNLANVNTSGFKRSRLDFADLLYTTMKQPGTSASADQRTPTGLQIGSGVRAVGTTKLFSPGSFEQTGNSLDVAIEGDGFFKVLPPGGGERLTSTQTAFVDIRRRQALLVARRTIGRLMPVTENNAALETRYVDGRRDELQIKDPAGMSARRTIRAGEVLTLSDLQDSPGQAVSEQVIRPRDTVRILGERKGLKFIVPAAESLELGRVGQLIRVRNLQSGKIVVGRVIGTGEVEVLLQ